MSHPEIWRREFAPVPKKGFHGHLRDEGLYEVGPVQTVQAVHPKHSLLLQYHNKSSARRHGLIDAHRLISFHVFIFRSRLATSTNGTEIKLMVGDIEYVLSVRPHFVSDLICLTVAVYNSTRGAKTCHLSSSLRQPTSGARTRISL